MLNQTKRCVETQTGETEDDDFEGDDEEDDEDCANFKEVEVMDDREDNVNGNIDEMVGRLYPFLNVLIRMKKLN